MQGFEVIALFERTLKRLSKDLGFNYKGGQVATANANVHSNPFYNALQMGVGFASAFTGGYKSKAKCFVAGTLVLTANGVVAIEMIKAGDLVYAAHDETLEYGIRPVVETYVRETDKLVHITIAGEEIVSTFDHPYYVKGKGFVNAADLCIGYELIDNNGKNLVVEQIFCEKLNEEKVKVYNFQVEDYHTYYVGESGVLVHNATKGYSGRERMGKQKGKSPRDQQKQQRQVKAIVSELRKRGVSESDIKDNMHDILHDEGMDYSDALKEVLAFFGFDK
jgi:hypothetical protein